ncbi:hypothetical protein SPONL_1420 [uncultured Candidatus Thioglobus sp.]|nr:hypothetical protein SPONL_1420 [uncultured Candidatus Thioglobus sp.]
MPSVWVLIGLGAGMKKTCYFEPINFHHLTKILRWHILT